MKAEFTLLTLCPSSVIHTGAVFVLYVENWELVESRQCAEWVTRIMHWMRSQYNRPAHVPMIIFVETLLFKSCQILRRGSSRKMGFTHNNKTSGHSVFIAKNLLLVDYSFFTRVVLLASFILLPYSSIEEAFLVIWLLLWLNRDGYSM